MSYNEVVGSVRAVFSDGTISPFAWILGSIVASGRETAAATPGKYHVRVHFGVLLSRPSYIS